MVEVPIAETLICFSGVPGLLRGHQYMSNLDNRVITPHLSAQPCKNLYPMLVKSAASAGSQCQQECCKSKLLHGWKSLVLINLQKHHGGAKEQGELSASSCISAVSTPKVT